MFIYELVFFINLRKWGLIRVITVTRKTTAELVEIVRKAWFWQKKKKLYQTLSQKTPNDNLFQKNPNMSPVTRLFYSKLTDSGRNEEDNTFSINGKVSLLRINLHLVG